MTLYTLITNIQNLAKMEPNIGFITQGDIYSLNHIQDVVYPAFVITLALHTGSYYNEYENYNITMFLVDRLVEDKSNELDVLSWANTCIQNILHRIEETNLGIVGDVFTVLTFTEKFDSLCAGAYATINIRVPILQCECGCNCGGTPEPGPTPGGGVTEEKVIEIATEIVDEKLVHYVDNETFAELENTVDEKQDKLKYYTESDLGGKISVINEENSLSTLISVDKGFGNTLINTIKYDMSAPVGAALNVNYNNAGFNVADEVNGFSSTLNINSSTITLAADEYDTKKKTVLKLSDYAYLNDSSIATISDLENLSPNLKYYTEGSNTFETRLRQPGIPGLILEKIATIDGNLSNILISVSEGNEAGSIYLDKDNININTEYLRLGEPNPEKGLKILPGLMYFDNELFYSNGKLVNYYDKTDIDNKIGDINSILNTI